MVARVPIPLEVLNTSGVKELHVFYLSDSVFIAPLLLLLVAMVDRAKLKVPVGRCIGIVYPDIEKCMSVLVTPEALRPSVQTGTIISIGGGVGKGLCDQSLEWWLCANIMSCLRHDIGPCSHCV